AFAIYPLYARVPSTIHASVPIMTGVIAHVFFRDYLTKRQLIGLIIGLLGVALLMFQQLQNNIGSLHAFIVALLACLSYAVSSNLAKHYLSHISSITVASSGLLISGILALPIVILTFPDRLISTKAWLALLGIAMLSTAIAMILFYQILKAIGPTKTSTQTLLLPISGIFWGILLLDEKLSISMLIGTVIILLGTAISIFHIKISNTAIKLR
ncbi:MAG: DMT family transporter, partial [Ostreibacterium sp.]